MKKFITKRIAMFLALFLFCAYLSVDAQASERNITPDCQHPHYQITPYSDICASDENGHYTRYGDLYSCPDCGNTVFYIYRTIYEPHSWDENNTCIYCGDNESWYD